MISPMKTGNLGDRKECAVTVGTIAGQPISGRIHEFSPYSPNIVVEFERGRRLLQVEQVAWVGFAGDAPGPRPSAASLGRFRIHVAGGAAFAVAMDPGDLENPLGFYALPDEATSQHGELFFFAHGVNAKERNAPLGEMLVEAGVLRTDGLSRGLESQETQRKACIGEILVEQQKVGADGVDEALRLQERKRMRLGDILVDAGLVTRQDVEAALAEQKQRKGKRLGQVLIEMGILKERDLAVTLAKKFQMPFIDLDQVHRNPAATAEVPAELIKKFAFVPIDLDERTLTVAIGDPLATELHDVLRFQTNRRIIEVLAMPSQLAEHVEKLLANPVAAQSDEMEKILKDLSSSGEVEEVEEVADNQSDSATIRLANQIIIDAFRRGASDIHIEPNGAERPVRIRFRIDGDCLAYQDIQPSLRSALVSRFKIMSKIDISEKRKPQDGKIRFRIADRQIELRVATLPTVNGNEDVVLRILAGSKPLPLERMGFSPRNLRALRDLVTKPYGLVLCVGPTGSGKTTTLHSALGAINTVDMKIWTAEDPVEITQPGLRQVQVNAKIGFTFAQAMRAFLRADPDVIMIGELRDHETASIAVEASLTGHLVMSTLHTNSAPETITRLIDMGIEPFSFADALLGVLAQRLARGLCPVCRVPYQASTEEYEKLAAAYGADALAENLGVLRASDLTLFKGHGCEACGKTGLKGRVALHELLTIDDDLRRLVQHKAPVEELRRVGRASGMTTLLEDGVEKVIAGQTDLSQVLAVASR